MKNHWIIYLFIICHVCGLIYGNLELTQTYASQLNHPDKHGYQSVVPGTEKHKYGYQLKTSGKHFHHTSTEKDGVRLGCYGYEVEGKQYVTQYVADSRGYRLVTTEDQITVYPKFGAPEGKAQFGFRPFDDDDDAPRNVRYFFPKGCKGVDVQIDNSSRLRSLKFDKSAKLPVTFKPVIPDSYFYNTPPPNYPGPANIYAPMMNMIHVPTARPPLMVAHRPQKPPSTYIPPEKPTNIYLPPDSTTLAPEKPDNTYSPPVEPEITPEQPDNTYLPPVEPENTYLPPEKPENTYLPPEQPTNTYLPPQKPTNTYLPPVDSTSEVPASVDLVTDETDNIPVDPLPEEIDNIPVDPLPEETDNIGIDPPIDPVPEEPDNTYLPPNEPDNTYIPPPTPNNTYIPPFEVIPSTTEEIDLLPPLCPTESCCKDSLGKIVIPIKLKGQKSNNCCNYAKIILPIKYFNDIDFKKFKESLPQEIDTNMIIRHILENLL